MTSGLNHIKKVPIIVIALFVSAFQSTALADKNRDSDRQISLTIDAIDESAGGVSCFKIETPTAVYFLEKVGMGLSSMLDKDDNDWIGFHNKPGTGAAGEYRGFPNAIHIQDGSFFHPKNQGTDPSAGEVIRNSPDHVTIRATSGNKNWEGVWDFYADRCTFTMTKMPIGRKYWILYEGTPGGQYDDSDWWMTSDIEEKQPLTNIKDGDIPGPEWIAFGDRRLNRSIFLLHHEDDEATDKFYQMQKKMTVFGFGRKGITKFLDKVPRNFSIGFIESDKHSDISEVMENILNCENSKTFEEQKLLTPEKWLVKIEEQTEAEKASWDWQWRDVMLGAATSMEPYDGRPEVTAKFTGEKKRLHEEWLNVWNRHVYSIADLLLAGGYVSDKNRKYRFLASGTLLHRYHRHGIKQKEKRKEILSAEESQIAQYAHRVEEEGKAILTKCYLSGKLTQNDIDTLRDYAMFIDIRCTGNGVLPCHLKLTRSRYGGEGFRIPGETAPDFALARMEAFLDAPSYSDANPRDPIDILTPLAVKEFLQIMCGYQVHQHKFKAKAYEIYPGKEKHYVRLSDYRGKKPVMMVFMNATDPWAWHGRIAPLFEPLKQALQDRIQIFFICTTIHDTRMPSMDFMDSPPRKAEYVHETIPEHRARICKMFYMGWPDCTTDYLLDDMAQHFRNEWMDQGGGAYIVLVDKEGTIAYTDYHKDIPPHWGPKAVNFPYEFLTIRMNHLESRLESFFTNNCRYDKKIETNYPQWRLENQKDNVTFDKHSKNTIWMPAKVVSVNPATQEVIIERYLPSREQMKGLGFWGQADNRAKAFDPIVKARLETIRRWLSDQRKSPTYTLIIHEATDVFVNGWQKPLTSLQPGDRVGIYYAIEQANSYMIKPIQIRVYRFP